MAPRVVLHSCTKLWHSSLSWARRFSDFLGVYSSLAPMSTNFSLVSTRRLWFCFLFIKSPFLSLFTKLWIVSWELFHHEIYVEIFADTFQQIRISNRCHTEIHVALKHREPCRATLLTVNREQMARGADNYYLLLTNRKQTPINEPHSPPCNIILCRGLQVNYFPSFQTLSAVKHAESWANFACA
jgi:hypothetical protein